MKGQGAQVLVLWDESAFEDGGQEIPGVPAPLLGMEPLGFDPREKDLAGLRAGIGKWAASIRESSGEK